MDNHQNGNASNAFSFKNWLKKNWIILLSLTTLVFISYVNALQNSFISDDIAAIETNVNIGDLNAVFSQPTSFLRPLSNFIIYHLFGLNPLFYRLVNIFLHLGSVFLVFILIDYLHHRKIAIFAAAIFAVHPILIESVSWISGGIYAQYSFFLLLAFFLYIISSRNPLYLFLSIFCFFIALFSSEKAIVFPFIILLYEISFKDLRKDWKKFIPFIIVGGIFILIYISKIGQRIQDVTNQSYQQAELLNPLVQIPIAITNYIQLILWPMNLTLYQSEVGVLSSFEFIIRSIAFLLFIGIILYSYKKSRALFFWLCFFVITLLPTLTPLRISWLVAERYVYLGSLGIIVAIAFGIEKLDRVKSIKTLSYIILTCVVIFFSVRTIIRNADWYSQDTLWPATVISSPSSPLAHNNMGDFYGRHGNHEEAIIEFKKAIIIQPRYADAYNNVGNVYLEIGKHNEALESYKKAVLYNPSIWQSYMGQAIAYYNLNKKDEAIKVIQEGMKTFPQNYNFPLTLGTIYAEMNRKKEAEQLFLSILRKDPSNVQAKGALEKLQKTSATP